MGRRRVVIVGGGFGGLHAAAALRDADVDVLVLDKRNHHLFQPLLYQVATASLAPSDIAEPLRVVLAVQANADVRLAEVVAVDRGSRTVRTAEGDSFAYDWLVVAAGARTAYFGHDGWAEHAPGLKTIGDALAIRRRVLAALELADWSADAETRRRLLTFVVVGAGPTGVEMAGALREIALGSIPSDYRHLAVSEVRVILVEAGPAVLPPFPPDLQAAARDGLAQLGVEVRTGASVREIGEGYLVVGEERIEASAII
jgi:NADH dehydrogenase